MVVALARVRLFEELSPTVTIGDTAWRDSPFSGVDSCCLGLGLTFEMRGLGFEALSLDFVVVFVCLRCGVWCLVFGVWCLAFRV